MSWMERTPASGWVLPLATVVCVLGFGLGASAAGMTQEAEKAKRKPAEQGQGLQAEVRAALAGDREATAKLRARGPAAMALVRAEIGNDAQRAQYQRLAEGVARDAIVAAMQRDSGLIYAGQFEHL